MSIPLQTASGVAPISRVLLLGALLAWSPAGVADWLDETRVSGSLNYWYRDRVRAGFDAASGRDTRKTRNLLHATGHANLLFESG